MSKKRHLSYSAVNRYLTCGKSYEHYYVNNIREKNIGSALVFGKAIDNALNDILIDIKNNTIPDYEKHFDKYWDKVIINSVEYNLSDCELINYANYEFIYELLNKQDKKTIREYIRNNLKDVKFKLLDAYYQELNQKQLDNNLELNEKRVYNLFNWYCLKRKAYGMISAYIKEVVPHFNSIDEIQKNIKFTANDGRELIGVIDLIATSKKYGNKVIIDNKTSRRKYQPKQLYESPQLALYLVHEELEYAGFAVLVKEPKIIKIGKCNTCKTEGSTLKKNCPICKEKLEITKKFEFYTQYLTGKLDKYVLNDTMQTITNVKESIDSGIFPRNLDKCKNMYGSICPYYNLCHNNSMENLIKVEDKNGN